MNCDASGKSLEKQHRYLTRNKHIPNLPQVYENVSKKFLDEVYQFVFGTLKRNNELSKP